MRLGVPSGNPATPSMTPPQKPSGRKSSKETISVSDIFSSKKPGDNAYQKLLESSSSVSSTCLELICALFRRYPQAQRVSPISGLDHSNYITPDVTF